MVKNAEEISATSTAIATNTSPAQDSEFTRANIEALGEQVRVADSDGDLSLFCYTNCDSNDSALLKQSRGVVFDGVELIMKGFPFTNDYTHEETEKIENAIPDITKCVCYEAHEGALIRVFFHEKSDKWYVSTHRRLDAYRSKWASKDSFGHAFEKAIEYLEETVPAFSISLGDGEASVKDKFFDTLDKKHQYMFLVRNSSENRIVCDTPDTPTIYQVGIFTGGNLIPEEEIKFIPSPESFRFSSTIELQDHVYTKCNARRVQGLIVFQGDSVLCKVVNSEYQAMFDVRGNEPSRKFRYLQVRMDRKLNNALRRLYPDSIPVFEEYEDYIYEVAQSVHASYVKRFIRKQFVTVPHEEFAVIKACHAFYESDRKTNKVTINKVIDILNSQEPSKVNHMIRRVIADKLKQVQEEKEACQRSGTPPMSPVAAPVAILTRTAS
jgi:hypothetical protein